MKLSDKLKEKKQKMQEQMQRGRIVTAEMKAEKMRWKTEHAKSFEPGTFRYGIHHRQGVGDFMRDVKERRQEKRKQNR